jgi:hypothetical protein
MPELKPAHKSVVDIHRYTEEDKQMSSPGQLRSIKKLYDEMTPKQNPPQMYPIPKWRTKGEKFMEEDAN